MGGRTYSLKSIPNHRVLRSFSWQFYLLLWCFLFCKEDVTLSIYTGPCTIGKCKLFKIKHTTLLEGEIFLRNKHKIAFFFWIKCTFFGRKETIIRVFVRICWEFIFSFWCMTWGLNHGLTFEKSIHYLGLTIYKFVMELPIIFIFFEKI